MSEADLEQRTEPPSPRRLRRARRRGELPRSPLAASALVLVAGGAGAALWTPRAIGELASFAASAFASGATGGDAAARWLARAHDLTLYSLAAPLAAAALGATFASIAAGAPVWAPDAVRADTSRLDPGRGLRRIIGAGGLLSRFAPLTLMGGLAAVALVTLRERLPAMFGQVPLGLTERHVEGAGGTWSAGLVDALGVTLAQLVALSAPVLLGAAGVAALWARSRWQMRLRMTRHEARREAREAEGDPQAKRERARRARPIAAASASDEEVRLLIRAPGILAEVRRRPGDAPRLVSVATGLEASRVPRGERDPALVVSDPGLAARLRAAPKTEAQEIPRRLWPRIARHLAGARRRP